MTSFNPNKSGCMGLRPSRSEEAVVGLERRAHRRYVIEARLHYLIGGIRGEGSTFNIGSSGLLMNIGQVLPIGRKVQVMIEWPVRLEDHIPLDLVLIGKVLRGSSQGTAVRI